MRNKWWAGTGLNRRHQDFQTLPHLPARTDDLFVSVITRAFLRVDLAYPSGSSRIETHDSVRVEFESTGAMRTARIRRKVKDPPGGSSARPNPRATTYSLTCPRAPSRGGPPHAVQG